MLDVQAYVCQYSMHLEINTFHEMTHSCAVGFNGFVLYVAFASIGPFICHMCAQSVCIPSSIVQWLLESLIIYELITVEIRLNSSNSAIFQSQVRSAINSAAVIFTTHIHHF